MFRKRKQRTKDGKKTGILKKSEKISSVSFNDDEEEEEVFTISKSKPRTSIPQSSSTSEEYNPVQDNFKSGAADYSFIKKKVEKKVEDDVVMGESIVDDDLDDDSYMIPTQSMIDRAKKKREQMRKVAEGDFIPLGDENDDIPMSVADNIMDDGFDNNDFDEIDHFETMRDEDSHIPLDLSFEKAGRQQTISSVMSSIREQIDSMKRQHTNCGIELEKIHNDVEEEQKEINIMKEKLHLLLSQSGDLSNYKSFIHDLMQCFELNLPTISKLEERVSELTENYLQHSQDLYFENDSTYFHIKDKRREHWNLSIPEGFSSDDEWEISMEQANPIPQKHYQEFLLNLNTIHCEVTSLLEQDLPPIEEIINLFTEWKEKHPSAYDSAYCHTSLWATLSPIVRAELILWDPILFSTSCTSANSYHHPSFLKLNWFTTIEQNINSLEIEDLLKKLVEEELIPKIQDLVHSPWDVYSYSQNKRFISIITDISEFYKSLDENSTIGTGIVDGLLIKILAKFYHVLQDKRFPNNHMRNINRILKVSKKKITILYCDN